MVAKKGPASALEGGAGSEKEAEDKAKGQRYSVQLHTEDRGLEVRYVNAESGDEAAKKVLESCGYKGASIRGVTPATDPDPNSLGGERDAAQMISNAGNDGHMINTLGTEANAEATEKLGRADVSELKD